MLYYYWLLEFLLGARPSVFANILKSKSTFSVSQYSIMGGTVQMDLRITKKAKWRYVQPDSGFIQPNVYLCPYQPGTLKAVYAIDLFTVYTKRNLKQIRNNQNQARARRCITCVCFTQTYFVSVYVYLYIQAYIHTYIL